MQLPDKFVTRMAADGLSDVTAALTTTPPTVAVRINRAKGCGVPEGSRRVAWNADGFYLDSRPSFTFDPLFHQGLYYVQDASSMAVTAGVAKAMTLLDVEGRPLRYLDACAAPGGKTTAALSVLPPDSFVVANEFDPRRASILRENIAKWGRPAVVTRQDASTIRRLDGFFDIICADMPCSGEGMMRKDEFAVSQWSESLVNDCAALQRSIASRLWECLAPGGLMIYSTCTFNTTENEDNVGWLIDNFGAEPIEIESLTTAEGIGGPLAPYSFPAYRFMPGRTEGEGLFMALLRKPETDSPRRSLRPQRQKPAPATINFLNGSWTYRTVENAVYALPQSHDALLDAVASGMHVISPGIDTGEIKGKDFIPHQGLAMAVNLRRDAFPSADITLSESLAYLRRENISLSDAPKGVVLLNYGDRPLGFVKNLGNRSNNLYPAEWRIRSCVPPGFVPDSVFLLPEGGDS